MCGLSLVAASRGHSLLRCVGFSLQSMGSRCAGFSSCGTRAQLLHGMWDLPRPGIEPESPALAGRFLTTAPPGRTHSWHFLTLGSPFKSSSQKAGTLVSLLCLALPVTFSVWSQVAGGQEGENSNRIHSRPFGPQLLWSEERVPLLQSLAAAATTHATTDLEPLHLGFNGIKPYPGILALWYGHWIRKPSRFSQIMLR